MTRSRSRWGVENLNIASQILWRLLHLLILFFGSMSWTRMWGQENWFDSFQAVLKDSEEEEDLEQREYKRPLEVAQQEPIDDAARKLERREEDKESSTPPKSMETLVDLSASTLEKNDDIVSKSAEKEMYLKIGSNSEKFQSASSLSNDRLVKQSGKESRKKNNSNYDLQREILGALFAAPERVEELPKKPSIRTRRSRMYGRTIVEPVKETNIEQTFVAVKPLSGHSEDIEDENSLPVLCQAVKENWATMKEYYKAATDAYVMGDRVRAYKLIKEGQFYNQKAREADEKSVQKLLETSAEEEMLLDISTLEPKEAIKLVKLHLSNFAGIPSFKTSGEGIYSID